jgi:hypothetical protein
MKKNRKNSLRLHAETLRRLDVSGGSGPETRAFTNCEYCNLPETRGFTNCEYCGPTTSGPSVNAYCGPDQPATA